MAHRLKGRCGYSLDKPFKPTFHGDRILQPLQLKKPSKIFTVSMGEFFDPDVPDLWRDLVFRVIREAQQHTFQILTKRPELIPYYEYELPSNIWLGVSQDGTTSDTYWAIEEIFQTSAKVRFVSFEPLLGPVEFDAELVDWIIIGAQTGPRAKQPRREWIHDILLQASEYDVPVFVKDNIDWKGSTPRPQEFPKEMI
jgi:protein gp37